MRRPCIVALTICGVLIALLPGAAKGAEEQAGSAPLDEPNVRITLTAGKIEGGPDSTEKVYRILTRAGGPPARLLVGWRMPIPTTQSSDEGEVSFVYQNVGMSAHLETALLSGDRVLVRGMIEISGRKKGAPEAAADAGRPPIIGTFQQDLSVVLRDGEPLRVAELPDPEGGTLFLDMRAEVLR